MHVILASASPRRAALLEQIGVEFEASNADIDESPRPGETAESLALRLAEAKAAALARPDALVLGSDTVVALDDELFGKPAGRDDAVRMLSRLSGRTHRVCSGVAAIYGRRRASRLCVSHVTMAALDEHAIDAYWASGEPLGKAGGYAIQGLGAVFVAHLAGSYSGVMGLPLFETAELLRAFGIMPVGCIAARFERW